MSSINLSTIVATGPLQITAPSISVSNQFVTLTGTTSSNTGGNMSYSIPSNGPAWLIGAANNVLQLAKGQYLFHVFCNTTTGQAGAAGSYGDIGISQNGTNLTSERKNFNGLGSGTATFMNSMTVLQTDGTTTQGVASYVALTSITFSNTTQTHSIKITKLG